MRCKSLIAVSSLLMASTAFGQEYLTVGLGQARYNYDSYSFVNPRITGTAIANSDSDQTRGYIGLGRKFDGFRGEIEFSFGDKAKFTSYHTPFNTFAQVKEVKSNRLMVTLFKDIDLGASVKPYLSVGLGIAQNEAEGFQGPNRDRFGKQRSENLAWSLGFGGALDVDKSVAVTLGYQYVDAGKADTGRSLFAPNDEQFKGRLTSHEIKVGLRYSF